MPPPQKSEPQSPSLSEVHESVPVPARGPGWRRWMAITGPALLVSVGYMDPGNWATDLAGGSRYGYRLIWVLLMSNVMAILLQSLAARLGIVARRDLAQACRETFSAPVNLALYAVAEVAITAMDLAEVIGSAIALKLLFGLPLTLGVMLTIFDVLALLLLSRLGVRKLEAIILAMVATIGLAFIVELFFAQPSWQGIAQGFAPSIPDRGALYIALGILGATVMPHNLYLHSALVQTRRLGRSPAEIRGAIRLNTLDSGIALNLAFLVNAAILVMAAAVFHSSGHAEVADIEDAHRLLEPLLGSALAPLAFAIALLASGQSSTITGTLAGQILMEGHLHFRIRPWLRRLITRLAAIVPALWAVLWFGEGSSGDLLVLSQVVLSIQLPFAIIPMIHFVSDARRMGRFRIGLITRVMAWLVTATIVSLISVLVAGEISAWITRTGQSWWMLHVLVLGLVLALVLLLAYVTFGPLVNLWPRVRDRAQAVGIHHEPAAASIVAGDVEPYGRVCICLDFGRGDERLIQEALRMGDRRQTCLQLLHVVESPAARALGEPAGDLETGADERRLQHYSELLAGRGFESSWCLGAGDVVQELARMIEAFDADLVILGGHGHRWVADLVFGETADPLRHRVAASVLVVPLD